MDVVAVVVGRMKLLLLPQAVPFESPWAWVAGFADTLGMVCPEAVVRASNVENTGFEQDHGTKHSAAKAAAPCSEPPEPVLVVKISTQWGRGSRGRNREEPRTFQRE